MGKGAGITRRVGGGEVGAMTIGDGWAGMGVSTGSELALKDSGEGLEFVVMGVSGVGWRVMLEMATAPIKPPTSKLPKIPAGFCQFLGGMICRGANGSVFGWDGAVVGGMVTVFCDTWLADCKAYSILLAVV
jgi:hypothetical protein